MIQKMSRQFIEAEGEARLFDYSYRDVPLWWFVRLHVFSECLKGASGIDLGMNRASALSPLQAVKYLRDAFRPQRLRRHSILAISTSSARRSKVGGRDFDVFYDSLSWTRFRDDYAVIETPDRATHRRDPVSQTRYYGDSYLLAANLMRRVGRMLSALPVSPALDKFAVTVEKALTAGGLSCPVGLIREIIYSETAFAMAAIRYAGHCLDRVRPEVLLVQSGSASSRLAFQCAAKKRRIPIVEVQHGLIVDDSLVYFHGFEGKPGKKDPVPDEVFVYGEHFKKVLSRSRVCRSARITVTGNAYFQWERERFLEKRKKGTGVLLLTTIPELAPFYVRLALELREKYSGGIIVKPHPSEYDRAPASYASIKDLPGITLLPPDVSLFEAFERSEFHVSVGSLTQLESISVGLKNIIVAHAGFEEFVGFLKELGIPVAATSEEVLAFVRDYPSVETARRYVNEQVWSIAKDPARKLEKAIERYVK